MTLPRQEFRPWCVTVRSLMEFFMDAPPLSEAIVAHNKKADGYQIALNKKVWRQMMRELIILRRAEKLLAKEMNRNDISGYAPGRSTDIRSQILFLEDLRAAFHGQARTPRLLVYLASHDTWSLVELRKDAPYHMIYLKDGVKPAEVVTTIPGVQPGVWPNKNALLEQPNLMIDHACSINHRGRRLIVQSSKRP